MTVTTLKCAVMLGLVVCAIGGASAAARSGQITGWVIDATGGVLPSAVEANLRSEPDANTKETVSARLSLLWQATPELSALFAYHLQDQQVGARQINHVRSFDTGRARVVLFVCHCSRVFSTTS